MGPPAADRRFPRDARLRGRADFDRVFRTGTKRVGPGLVMLLRELPEDAPRSRLGVSVSRKVGDAPERNRVKRCLREAFRHLAPRLDPPVEIVLIARPGHAPRTRADAERALSALLRRAGR